MPRRQRGEGSVFQRAEDGIWVGRVDLGIVDGKRKRKTVYAQTQAGAVRKLREARKAVDAGDTSTASTPLEKWLTYWLDEVCPAKGIKPKTLRTYRSYVEQHINPTIGKVRLDKLNISHVRELAAAIDEQGLSTMTARHAHRILHTALNDAMREGKATRNVATLTKAPRVIKTEQRALSLAEVRAVFKQIETLRLRSRWEMALTTGARQGECLGLLWDRVNLDQGVIDLAWQLQRIPYKHGCPGGRCGRDPGRCPDRALDVHRGFEHTVLDGNMALQRPKTAGSTRVVVMTAPLVESMRARWADYLTERDSYKVDHGLVWCREDGRPLDNKHDYKEWRSILASAGVPAMPLHAARHTASTLLLALGVDEQTRMSMLGHSEAVTTRRYSHVDLTLQRNAMALLEAAIVDA